MDDLSTIIIELAICIIATVLGCTAEPVCPEHAALIMIMMPIPIICGIAKIYDLVKYLKKRRP